jgi:putative addiction module component (TIGR02574 family)
MAATKAEVTKADILEMAKKLSYDERSELVGELEATLHPPAGPPMIDTEFRAELDRRWEEYKSGKVKGFTWEEVKEEARRRNLRND